MSRLLPRILSLTLEALAALCFSMPPALAQGLIGEKLPVPGEAQQAEAERKVREEHKGRYARKEGAALKALASDLLQTGQLRASDPTLRFVLFREARDLAARAGEAALALQAVDEIERRYDVKGLEMQVETLTATGRAARQPVANAAVAEGTLSALARAITEENQAAAARLVQLASAAAGKSRMKDLTSRVQTAERELRSFQKDHQEMKLAATTLIGKPQDPEANLVVGRYLAFWRGELERAILHLARATPSALQAAAGKEIARPAEPAEQAALGDLWLKASSECGALAREGGSLLYRAYFVARDLEAKATGWYDSARLRLEGPIREEVARKSERLETSTRTQAVGGQEGRSFEEVAAGKGMLIGFRYSVHSSGGAMTIQVDALQPVFQTREGRVLGALQGTASGLLREVVARPGYAVGGMAARGRTRLNGFRLVFFRLQGTQLDREDRYESEWAGGTGGGSEVALGGAVGPALGIHGKRGDELHSLGLVLAP